MTERRPLYNPAELSAMFADHDLDAIVVRSGRNVAYLSGMLFPGTLGRLQDFAHSPRAALIVWPRDGEPTLFVSQIAFELARRDSWIQDIRPFVEYSDSPYRLVARRLQELGRSTGRIGVERREMGADHWREFADELPGAELIECTAMLEGVRNIKTPDEIALLQQAVDIQDRAHLEVFSTVREGDTERKLHSRMVASMIAQGAESAHGMMQASTTPMTYGGEGDAEIKRGVVVRTDYVCYYRGYAANLSRMAIMGEPDEQQRHRYSVVRDTHRAAIETALRPGVEARKVHAFVKSRFEAAGFEWNKSLVGHSVGIWWHQEEPMLVPGETRKLREGMVVCLEPVLETFWHLQDQLLITPDGAKLMSGDFDTDELFRLGEGR